jgi:hypothetical protein
MANVKLQRIEVLGDPKASSDAKLPIRLVYSDHVELAQATVSVVIQVVSEAAYGRVLAEVERAALEQAKRLIDGEIQQIRQLESRRA